MNRLYILTILLFLLILSVKHSSAQADTINNSGVKIRVPDRGKKTNSYYFISIGYQNASWYTVPMIPENPLNLQIKDNSKIKVPGYFAGIGIMKKTRTHFEVGLLADFYKTSIPVAFAGQRSKGDWLLEQSGYYFTQEVFENDINRVSEVFAVRASIRYRIPVGNLQFWGGLAPGTFSNNIYFSEKTKNEPVGVYRAISVGLSYQAGINFLIKDKNKKDILRFTFFADFSGPRVEEKMTGLLNHPAWKYSNSEGNTAINPVRFGFAIGIH